MAKKTINHVSDEDLAGYYRVKGAFEGSDIPDDELIDEILAEQARREVVHAVGTILKHPDAFMALLRMGWDRADDSASPIIEQAEGFYGCDLIERMIAARDAAKGQGAAEQSSEGVIDAEIPF